MKARGKNKWMAKIKAADIEKIAVAANDANGSTSVKTLHFRGFKK